MKRYGVWKVTLPDQEFTWEPDEATVSDCYEIARESGQAYEDWINSIDQRDPLACQVLIWFLLRQKGEQLDRAGIDFKLRQLDTERVPVPKGRASKTPAPST